VVVLADTTNAEWRSKTAKATARKVELADCSFAVFGIPLPEHFRFVSNRFTKWVAHDLTLVTCCPLQEAETGHPELPVDGGQGEAAAVALGEAFRSIGIPVGQVYTSRFNRAYQTAKLAGFAPIEKSIDITEGGLVVSPNENTRRAQAFRKLASIPPPAGTNVVIITHKPNILDAFGKDWFEVKEGEATIFKPEASGYKLLARVEMADWARIATAAKN